MYDFSIKEAKRIDERLSSCIDDNLAMHHHDAKELMSIVQKLGAIEDWQSKMKLNQRYLKE